MAAGLLFAALVAAGIRPSLLRLLLPPHHPPPQPAPGAALDRWPLRWKSEYVTPELQRFLEEVRAQTRRGERVGLLLAPPYDGFGYTHWRASYALSGRTVLVPNDVIQWAEPPDVIVKWDAEHGGTIERLHP
ncbi:MAG TPA: hypothetical protein VND45_16415 [Thermoanaerobaculia bacterium]|nr:hypothetical protein [Thermoanaerobaculia bacterium]